MLRALTPLASALLLVAAPAGAATMQQDFDAAQALLDAGKIAEARDAFTSLLGRFSPTTKGMGPSLVRARLGNALIGLGDAETAEPLLAAAIAGFTGSDATSQEERGVALYDFARAREAQGKLDSAAKAYAQVRDARLFPADSPSDIGLRAALARSLIWANPDDARRLLDGLLALPPAKLGVSKDTLALVQTLRGRVELNDGKFLEARRWFNKAASSAGGGETRSVNLADIVIRGDQALANYLIGNMDEVQKAVAFSGAGGLIAEGMTSASDMPLPACAPVSGLAPDAVAVVQFAIGDDGRVSGVTPVYASRGSGDAVAGLVDSGPEVLFPQAVRRWVWSTANVAKLDKFWRQSVRVELRCFTARPDADPVADSFDGDYRRWAQSIGLRPMRNRFDNDAQALPVIRAELAQREAIDGAQSLQLIVPLGALASNDAAPRDERAAAARRRVALLIAANAPASILGRAQIGEIQWAASAEKSSRRQAEVTRDRLAPLLAAQESAGLGASRIAMATRLAIGEAQLTAKAPADARQQFETIVAAPDSLLPDGDPIRTKALLLLSNLAAAARDTEGAAKALAATGLSPEQCSLVDVKPQAINKSIGQSAFPDEALRWNTGGYARVGYDITAEGKTTNVRTIVATPPFIFGPATEQAVARFKYQPVFRPGNTIGCSGSTQSVMYKPGN